MKRNFCFLIFACGIAIGIWKIALLYERFSRAVVIPISLTSSNMPCLAIRIEGKPYPIGLDLGADTPLALNQRILNQVVKKESRGTSSFLDLQGNLYHSPLFVLPEVRIRNLHLKNIPTREDSETFHKNSILWSEEDNEFDPLGAIGRPLLKKTNLLLDILNLTVIACDSPRTLAKMGFSLDKMIYIPFIFSKKMIPVFEAETDAGLLRLSFDTGCTETIIRSSRLKDHPQTTDERELTICNSSCFMMGNHNFGTQRLLLCDLTPEIEEIDGMLGMDFISNHIMYIDYKNQALYFSK